MTAIAEEVDQDILKRIQSWTDGITGFETHHAADGLYIARSAMLSTEDIERTTAAAINTAFTFWIDDRSDKHLCQLVSPIDWDSLLDFTDGVSSPTAVPPGNPELRFLVGLSQLMKAKAPSEADFLLWRNTMGTVLRGMRFEEQLSRGEVKASYAEYIEAGAASIAMWVVVVGLYIANRIPRAKRFGEPWLEKLERYLGMSQRLTNDLFSAEKERAENKSGFVCNSVLLLESQFSSDGARAFVEAQNKGYERLVEQCLTELGERDPVTRMLRPMLRSIRDWYSKAPVRYGS